MNPLGLFLEPPGPLLTHLHTVHIAYSECLPTRLNPLAERTCFSQARKVKYWDGPRGGQKISDTVYRKFQNFIHQYNDCGRSLKAEMQSFPAETVEGFVEPQEMLAETIKIQATAVKSELEVLIKDAATLRFNYPGSPLCAARLCTSGVQGV